MEGVGELELATEEAELGVRSLFEMNFPTTRRAMVLEGYSPAAALATGEVPAEPESVRLEVVCSDFDGPGALQSGKFLWPASQGLASFLCSRAWCERLSRGGPAPRFRRVVELGAGAGLAGLATARLFAAHGHALEMVMLTDRDPFLLDMVTDSAALLPAAAARLVQTAELSWGADQAEAVQAVLAQAGDAGFDTVIAADVLYSTRSIHAVFETVGLLLRGARGGPAHFLLCSSFRVPETTRIVSSICDTMGLEREVLLNTLSASGQEGLIVELFSTASSAACSC